MSDTNETTEMDETTEATEAAKVPTELERVMDIVSDAKRREMADDDIIVILIQGGYPFAKAGRLFTKACQELGFSMSYKERTETAEQIIKEMGVELSDWATVEALAEHLTEQIEQTNVKQALAAIRKYAKNYEIELPKAPKKSRGDGAPRGFRAAMFDWMIENPNATEKGFGDYMVANEKNEAMTKRFWRMFEVAKKMARNIEPADEATE